MESEGFWGVITGIVGAIVPGLGSGASKKTKQQLAMVTEKVNVLQAENEKQTKLITYLMIGLVGVIVIVFFFVFLRRRR